MKRLALTISGFFLTILSTLAQLQPIDVTEKTFKIGTFGSEEFCYGFAKGDQIVFNFEELAGKELKSIEIIELPNNSKFTDFKSTKIVDKKISVYKNAVYQFKFSNSSLTGRTCRIKLQRIPASQDLANFKTNWIWKTVYDTTYTPYTEDSLVGYDDVHYTQIVKELKKTDTIVESLFTRNEIVHSCMYGNVITCDPANAKTYIEATLPINESATYQTKKVIAWSWLIGVDDAADNVIQNNKQKFLTNVTSTVAEKNVMYGIAIGAISYLAIPSKGQNVYYYFVSTVNDAMYFKNGLIFNAFDKGECSSASCGRNTINTQGSFYICLYNDNTTKSINVTVRVTAISLIKSYQDVSYDRVKSVPRYVKLYKKKMNVKSSKIKVNEE